jgi:peptidoglycan/LPS O-acetylase OafA/YrhL
MEVERIPRLANGKPDYVAITDRARASISPPARSRRWRRAPRQEQTVEDVFRDVLGRSTIADDDTFVSLGGDSLSYVETSIRLEQLLGRTPRDWHVTPVCELSQLTPRSHRMTSVETSVMLRAAAIVLVVGSHMNVFRLRGGAHVLLAVAGFNFARFELGRRDSSHRGRTAAHTIARIGVPASLWIGLHMLLAGGYSIGTLLLVNNYTGDSHRRGGRWEYWYVEVLVHILLVLFALMSIRRVRDVERRRPFTFVVALLALTLVVRFDVVQLGDPYNYLFRTHTVAWFFVIGWAMHRATTLSQRLLLSVATVVAAHGFFGEPGRDLLVTAGLLVLLWVPVIPVPRPLDRVAGWIAAASMVIYLTHWDVWPWALREFVPWAALPLTIAAGVAAWWLVGRLQVWSRAVRGSRGLPYQALSWATRKAGAQ